MGNNLDLLALAAVIEHAYDAPVVVGDVVRLSGGASRETYAIDVSYEGKSESLVLQRCAVRAADTERDLAVEASVLKAALSAGVPVPELIASSRDDESLGRPFLLSRFVDGESIARRIQRNDVHKHARSAFSEDCSIALARIHAIDPSTVTGLTGEDQLERYREALGELAQPHPTFELALRWLAASRPPDVAASVVHGDFRLGNLLIDGNGLTAVIDWEVAHLGDPMEDLGWLCTKAWRFGGRHDVGGIGSKEELFDAYENESGGAVDRDSVHWWQVFGSLKWGIICIRQASRHLTGETTSHELAAIGRRVCENEWDLLELLA